MTYHLRGTDQPLLMERDVPVYFFDDTLIAFHRRLTRKWLQADVYPYPVIVADKPWEGRILCLFGTVLPLPGEGYEMYYCNFINGSHESLMVATSKDGLGWEKPELQAVMRGGTGNNNVVLSSARQMDSPSIMHDPDDAMYPYKMIAFEQQREGRSRGENPYFGLHIYRSRDGRAWEKYQDGPSLHAGDRTNLLPVKQDGKYVIYTRHSDMMRTTGKRCIYRSESGNFLDWTPPELVLEPSLADEADVEFYGMSVFVRHGWFFGLLEYWHSERDLLEIHLAYSRDGKSWSIPDRRVPFIAGAYDWNRKWSSCASNGPIIIGSKMVFYVGGRHGAHMQELAVAHGAIGYATLTLDHFCALEATSEGEFITAPIEWPGGELVLNADTRESFDSHPHDVNGEIVIEVLDIGGQPVEGWSGEFGAVYKGNTHGSRTVSPSTVLWSGGKRFDDWKGRVFRLRFRMRHARLFTIAAGGTV